MPSNTQNARFGFCGKSIQSAFAFPERPYRRGYSPMFANGMTKMGACMTDSREDFGVVATDHSITAYQDCDS